MKRPSAAGLLLGVALVLAPLPAGVGQITRESAPAVVLADALPGEWTVATLSQPRSGAAAVAVGTQAIFAGGRLASRAASNAVDIYDATTGAWSTAALSRARSDVTAVAVGTRALFAAGRPDGEPSSSVVDVYDAASGQWSAETLPQVRAVSAWLVRGNSAVFIGPTDVTPNPYSLFAADTYDAASDTWSTTMLTPAPSGASAASAGGRLLLAGGDLACGKPCVGRASSTVYLYATATGRWTTAALSQARWALGATSLDTLAIFAGGRYETEDTLSSRVSRTVDLYQSTRHRWNTAALSQARSDLAAAAVGNKAIFVGGWLDNGSPSGAVDIYDAVTGTWGVAALSRPRAAATIAVVGAQAIFAGGESGTRLVSPVPSDAADVYDGATGAWSRATLSRPARDLGTVVVGTRALFYDRGTPLGGSPGTAVDAYDAPSHRWYVARLSQARSGVAAVAAGTKALFAGGVVGDRPSDRVDVYDAGRR